MDRRHPNTSLTGVLKKAAVLLRSVVMGNYHATFCRAVGEVTHLLTLIPNQIKQLSLFDSNLWSASLVIN